jgi:16S rRNA (cytosine1402-N4)-methyltransferase
MNEVYHIPAMLQETIEGLNIKPEGLYVDVTFGGGGHSRAILEAISSQQSAVSSQESAVSSQQSAVRSQQSGVRSQQSGVRSQQSAISQGHLYSFDQDKDALRNGIEDERWTFVHSNFRYLKNWMDYYGVEAIDGLLADLGVSFHHFDCPERGFSFRFSAPLDMRMNQTAKRTAADIINGYSEEELAKLFWLYGELKNGRGIAKNICKARAGKPIERTEELVAAAFKLKESELLGGNRNPGEELNIPTNAKKDLAKLFQALRIEVNDEMGALREMLVAARDLLKPGGRIAILTYHSLEDRLVKNFLRSGNLEGTIEKDFYGNILTPFTLIEKGREASDEEVERNPRARSAKLRVAEKVQMKN